MPIEALAPAGPVYSGDTPGRVLDGELFATLGETPLGVVTEDGVRVHLANVDGWWTPTDTTGTVDPRSNDDGGWLSAAFAQPRVIAVTLRLRGASWPHLNATIKEISAAVSLRSLVPFRVYDFDEVLEAAVRQGGPVLVSRNSAGAEMSLSLVAPDPRRYALETVVAQTGLPQTTGGLRTPLTTPLTLASVVASGVLSVTNDGNTETRPVLTVQGPSPAATLTHRQSNRSLRFYDAVPAGHALVIDTDRRTALLDGVAPRTISGTWFQYGPGQNDVAFTASTFDAAATLTSSHRNAWR